MSFMALFLAKGMPDCLLVGRLIWVLQPTEAVFSISVYIEQSPREKEKEINTVGPHPTT